MSRERNLTIAEHNNIVLTCMLCLVLILVLNAIGQTAATQQHSPALLLTMHCRTQGHIMAKQPLLKSNGDKVR